MKLLPLLLAKNRPIFFDIGANTGGYSAMLRAAFPNAVIHAFEPHPATFNRLVQNNAENFMHCHNAALGDNAGTMTLFDCANPSGSCFASLNRSVISQMNDSRVLEYRVEVQTLDDFAAKNKINSIDLLKIDTEGWEFSVLKGSHRLIQNHSIKCIQFEFNCQNVQTRVFFSDFQKLLPNYIFFRLLPSGLFPLNSDPLLTELFGYQNILAISKDEASGL
jgi:FkbM family methyltransferase